MSDYVEDKKLVLIVDDQPKVVRFIEIDLKLHGFEVIKATSGEEALEIINSKKPHIMILDIVMPGMDGLEVLRQLRAYSSMPVIAFSASVDSLDEALGVGADDYIAKPFKPEEMLGKIRALIN